MMSDSNLPIIVVCSEGAKTSQEIIDSKYLLPDLLYRIPHCIVNCMW